MLRDGLVTHDELATEKALAVDRIDFATVHAYKDSILRMAFDSFKQTERSELANAFKEFCRQHRAWLDDYALFRAFKDLHGGIAWNKCR